MATFQSLCKVINSDYSDDDIKLTLIALSQKKQAQFIDMLYYILEDDTPLFFELFGGQILKIPTKAEFSRINKDIKVFLYLLEKRTIEDPFKMASFKFCLFLDKIASIFVEYYDVFIKNNNIEQLDISLNENDMPLINNIYEKSLNLLELIKNNPSENKRYTYKRKNKRQECYDNESDIVNENNYNYLLDYEKLDDQNDDFFKNDDYINNDDNNCEEYENDSKQLSLFS